LGVERKGDDLDLKNITVTKSKEVKTGWQIWQTFLRRIMAQKGLFLQLWGWIGNDMEERTPHILQGANLSLFRGCNGNHPNNKDSRFWAVIPKWDLPNTWQECQQRDPVICALYILQSKPRSCKQPQCYL
jgi:hypothetical protein